MSRGAKPKVVYRVITGIWYPLIAIAVAAAALWLYVYFVVYDDVTLATFVTIIGTLGMFILLPLQGRLFWTRRIAVLKVTDSGFEAWTDVWIGPGKRLRFTGDDVVWSASLKDIPSLVMRVRRKDYAITIFSSNYGIQDEAALSAIAPGPMAEILAHRAAETAKKDAEHAAKEAERATIRAKWEKPQRKG